MNLEEHKYMVMLIIFLELDQKQELHMVAMFVNESSRNEHSL